MKNGKAGEPAGTRTRNPNIKSVVLYQLSYGLVAETTSKQAGNLVSLAGRVNPF